METAFNSETGSEQDQLVLVAEASASQLNAIARDYNWDMYPAAVLGAIARRPDCSLATAMRIFEHAEPGYYENPGPNSWLDPDILDLLHYIHDRINAGGYDHDPDDLPDPYGFNKWYVAPRATEDGRTQLWALDPDIVGVLFERAPAAKPAPKASAVADETANTVIEDLQGDRGAQTRAGLAFVAMSRAVQTRVLELIDQTDRSRLWKWRMVRRLKSHLPARPN